MRITKRQLKRIIKEAQRPLGIDSPLAPFTDEDSEKKDDLLGMYSDAYKYRYNVRPSGDTMQHMFATMTADEIGKEIDKEYDAAHATMKAEEEEQEASAERAEKEKELKAMQSDPEHREELPKSSGMRRRTEGKQMRITKRQLRRIIKEERARLLQEDSDDWASLIRDQARTDTEAFFGGIEKETPASRHRSGPEDAQDTIEGDIYSALSALRGGYWELIDKYNLDFKTMVTKVVREELN
jgi:hypothetical protein